jgi:hypothetical protein
MEYKGFKIIREDVGRTPNTRFIYKCGVFKAPRKKYVYSRIDWVLSLPDGERKDLELKHLTTNK